MANNDLSHTLLLMRYAYVRRLRRRWCRKGGKHFEL